MNLPKIKPEQFENDYFSIKGTPLLNTTLAFVDFQYSSNVGSLNNSIPMSTISPNIFQKSVQLKPLVFHNTLNVSNIANEFNKNFIKIISDLGEKHRNVDPVKIFDININDMRRKGMSPDRGIIAKLNNVSNYIATEGRIGPAQFIVSNSKTYTYILKHISSMGLFKGKVLWIGNMPYKIDNSVEDDIILFGRKNRIDQPGVHCLILTDEDGYIQFQSLVDPNLNTKIMLHYNIVDVGFQPYNQFFKINTRDITYYRNLKLQKIKEIYGI